MKDERITNKTAILFQSLPTCNTNPDCSTCLGIGNSNFDWEYLDPSLDFESLDKGKKLECRWCPGENQLTNQRPSFQVSTNHRPQPLL